MTPSRPLINDHDPRPTVVRVGDLLMPLYEPEDGSGLGVVMRRTSTGTVASVVRFSDFPALVVLTVEGDDGGWGTQVVMLSGGEVVLLTERLSGVLTVVSTISET
jgi:hypothetical protein